LTVRSWIANQLIAQNDATTNSWIWRMLKSGAGVQAYSRSRVAWKSHGETLLLLALVLFFVKTGFVPAWKHLNSDFPNYYLTARLYRQGYPLERVYEWTWFQRQSDHAGIEQRLVGYIPMTLPSALAVLPFSSLQPLQAKRCWLVLNLAFLLLIAVLLSRKTSLGWRRVGVLMLLAMIPLRSNFVFGQMHVLVLFLLTVSVWLYLKNQGFWSGVTLAAAAALKIYPALFLIFFLLKKQWRAACGLTLGLCAAASLSIYMFGVNACRFYMQEVLPWAMRGQTTDPYDVGWNSLNALLSHLFIAEPELNPAPVAHSPRLYAFLYSLIAVSIFVAFMWAISLRTSDRGRQKLEWASYLFLLLLLSSQPGTYHFVALILPTVLVTDYLVQRSQWFNAFFLVCVYTLTFRSFDRLCGTEPSGWKSLLCFPRLFFMTVFGGLLLWILISSSKASSDYRLRSRSSLFAAISFVILFAGSLTTTLLHFRGQFDNYASRVLTVSGSGIATDPIISSGNLFFTALVPRFIASIPDTYAVHELQAGSVKSFAVGGDWLHPALGKDSNTVWAEVAQSGESRVVRFSSTIPVTSEADITVEAEDAEQPIVSPDEKLLAFIREVNGRDSLWIQQIGSKQAEPETIRERQIVSSQYDVREAAFYPDHKVIFSSERSGRFRLYEVSPVSGAIEERTLPICSARYPAISPDEKWLAFSCEQRGTWQVHAMNLLTSEQVQLTNADCNSVSPTWTPDSKDLIYATDCGRGLGSTALARLNAVR
jgi:Glycosyltransferase family 87/WD40-like Beta Propeller Repeat